FRRAGFKIPFFPVESSIDGKPFFFQPLLERPDQRFVVFDQKNAHGFDPVSHGAPPTREPNPEGEWEDLARTTGATGRSNRQKMRAVGVRGYRHTHNPRTPIQLRTDQKTFMFFSSA